MWHLLTFKCFAQFVPISVALLLSACATPSRISKSTSRDDESTRTRAQDSALEKSPLGNFHINLNGFHFQSGDMGKQVEDHHFCSKLNDEVTQCVLFDGTGDTAHLTGIEYIVSKRMFESFPSAERKLWHSHVYEVKSGQLVSTGLPEPAERALMTQLISTYGKVWHTWQSQHGEQLPTGPPSLMMSFTADGQLKPELLNFRNERLQVSSSERQKQRASIPDPAISQDADSWEKGDALQLQVTSVKMTRK